MTKAEIIELIDEITPSANYNAERMNILLKAILNFGENTSAGNGGDIVTGNIVSGESPNKQVNQVQTNWNATEGLEELLNKPYISQNVVSTVNIVPSGVIDSIQSGRTEYYNNLNGFIIIGQISFACSSSGLGFIDIPINLNGQNILNGLVSINQSGDSTYAYLSTELTNGILRINVQCSQSQSYELQFIALYI